MFRHIRESLRGMTEVVKVFAALIGILGSKSRDRVAFENGRYHQLSRRIRIDSWNGPVDPTENYRTNSVMVATELLMTNCRLWFL